VHFRAGVGADGIETFTPRTVIYDLKGGFGSLRKFNALYDIHDDTAASRALWDGTTSTQHQQPIEPSKYQTHLEQGLPTFQLHDNDIRYWSDFNRVFFHPRSAVQINQYELNSQLMPFEKWDAGEDLFRDLDKAFDLLDRDIRPFAEECDQMQGFQILTGTDDAWGGFAARYLDNLRDEYGKTSIWTWGIEDGGQVPRDLRRVRSSNTARSMQALATQSSAYINLSTMPSPVPWYVNLQGRSEWLTSAFLCSGVESATLPSRLAAATNRQASLSLLEDTLNTNGGQMIFQLEMSVVDGYASGTPGQRNSGSNDVLGTGGDSNHTPNSNPVDLDINFMPNGRNRSRNEGHVFAQVETHRIQEEQPSVEELDSEQRMSMRLSQETIIDRYRTRLLFPMLDTFPNTLFASHRQGSGLALTTSLKTTSSVKVHVVRLRDDSLTGLGLDEREVLYNELTELANNYSFGWESGSDSGEDE
jgi:Tubulin domain/Misato Segment II tubulin-like domain